mgnify:FL=1
MTDKAAYARWEASVREVERIARDRSLPLWERAQRVGTAYTGVALDGLRSKHRTDDQHASGERTSRSMSRRDITRVVRSRDGLFSIPLPLLSKGASLLVLPILDVLLAPVTGLVSSSLGSGLTAQAEGILARGNR